VHSRPRKNTTPDFPAAPSPRRRPDGRNPITTYVICTNLRSGSWLLSAGLASTSLAGNPLEWLSLQQEQDFRAQWRINHQADLTLEGYLEAARPYSMTSNGVSGIKLHYYQFADLPRWMHARHGWRSMSPAEIMLAMYPQAKYMWLTRRDKVRQAISLYLATQTDQWFTVEGSDVRQAQLRSDDIKFDPHAIGTLQKMLEQNDHSWQVFFESNQITPLVIKYEEFASDYAGTIQSVLQWLGIPNANRVTIPAPRLRRQSTALNDKWTARYTTLTGGRPHSPLAAAAKPADLPSFTQPIEPFTYLPDSWRQWVAHARDLGYTPDAIAKVLIANGYSSDTAHAEARKAAFDP
jgi:LPS sulfotransferase NodH